MRTIRRVTNRVIQASQKADFEANLFAVLKANPEAIDEGILEGENASQRYHKNDPYETIKEFKRYDPDGYQRALERSQKELLSRLGRINFGQKGPIVFRALSLQNPQDFTEKLLTSQTHVGIYWSFTRGMARPYWAKAPTHKTVILEAELPPRSIDFLQLIKANTTRAFSQDENEITALPSTQVFILSIVFENQLTPVNRMHKT
jgi:hypothetical protein